MGGLLCVSGSGLRIPGSTQGPFIELIRLWEIFCKSWNPGYMGVPEEFHPEFLPEKCIPESGPKLVTGPARYFHSFLG